MRTFHGFTVSQGFAVGRIYKKEQNSVGSFEEFAADSSRELEELRLARQRSLEQLEELRLNAISEIGEKSAEIFEAHQSFLEDDCFFETIEEDIRENGHSAPWAVKQAGDAFAASLGQSKDKYLAERSADIRDIFDSLLRNLTGQGDKPLDDIPEHAVLVAKELTPSDTMKLDLHKVDAFVTETGGKNSHVAIIARAAGKAALVGAEGICEAVRNGEPVVVDGETGEIYLNPDEKTLLLCGRKLENEKNEKAKLQSLIGSRTETSDGHVVELFANIATPEDAALAQKNDAEGVGLFRTEFVFINRQAYPSEEEQFERYREAAEATRDKPLIIRTLDVGGDKTVSYFGIDKEENPFLGYRAIRICLDRVELFKTQLRAILRASAYGNIKIMFPMISGADELRRAKKLVQEVKDELSTEGIPFNESVPVGTMIEVPAAAVLADLLAEECDFFSIGTNDLVQYTLAADRGNANVASLYSPFHPAVLRTIRHIITCAHEKGIPVGICGEAAADIRMLPILLGLGIDELSVAPTAVLRCREAVRGISLERAQELTNEVMRLQTTSEIEAFLERETKQNNWYWRDTI